MDNALRVTKNLMIQMLLPRLNPCFNGKCSQRTINFKVDDLFDLS